MKYFSLALLLLAMASCTSPFQKQLNTADELTIHFYSSARADSVIKILRTNNKKAIEQLSSYIDTKQIKAPGCGHDGDIIFYQGTRVLQVVDFNLLQTNCRHFAFEANGKQFTTSINSEGADFLMALWAGKTSF
jgi:hypothetical protein